jgi:hypothetical protein
VIVIRDRETVADLSYFPDESGIGWLQDSETSCADF